MLLELIFWWIIKSTRRGGFIIILKNWQLVLNVLDLGFTKDQLEFNLLQEVVAGVKMAAINKWLPFFKIWWICYKSSICMRCMGALWLWLYKMCWYLLLVFNYHLQEVVRYRQNVLDCVHLC